ncbi:uncharacterized protein RAG0_11763 [Rhynchosporium agropyri]|uniref:Transcription factor domain-containing protein n=1 Tax=Rhynchosporium agropyri TaxID=914238 RepID=A0A1E1L5J5_9HELO|nr:uncharacterized protein RAG0_11763 [Rhynchosporium agropyri]
MLLVILNVEKQSAIGAFGYCLPAFHQLLSGAAIYFKNLHQRNGGQASGESLAHHAYSLQLVNDQMRNTESATTDGVISSIIGFAATTYAVPRHRWVHILTLHLAFDCGYEKLEKAFGGVERDHPSTSYQFTTLGYTELSNVDISGSCSMDEAPSFPLPEGLPPSTLPIPSSMTLSPFSQIELLHSSFPSNSELFNNLTQLDLESLHLQDKIKNTGGTILLNSTLDDMSQISAMADMLRLAAVLYLIAICQSFEIYPTRVTVQIRKLSASIMTSEGSGPNQRIWEDHGLGLAGLWIMSVGAILSDEKDKAAWFAKRLQDSIRRLSSLRTTCILHAEYLSHSSPPDLNDLLSIHCAMSLKRRLFCAVHNQVIFFFQVLLERILFHPYCNWPSLAGSERPRYFKCPNCYQPAPGHIEFARTPSDVRSSIISREYLSYKRLAYLSHQYVPPVFSITASIRHPVDTQILADIPLISLELPPIQIYQQLLRGTSQSRFSSGATYLSHMLDRVQGR